MQSIISRLLTDERGATSIEYALIASFIAIVIVTAVTTIGTKVGNSFDNVSTGLQ